MTHAVTQASSSAPDYTIDAVQSGLVIRPIPEGFRTWLPALFILIGMPFLALIVAKYVFVDSMKHAVAQVSKQTGALAEIPAFTFVKIPISDLGPAGIRSRFRDMALVAVDPNVKNKIDQNKARLLEVAAAILEDTSVSDVDRPEVIDAKRHELLEKFNNVLGGRYLTEVYLSQWSSQKR